MINNAIFKGIDTTGLFAHEGLRTYVFDNIKLDKVHEEIGALYYFDGTEWNAVEGITSAVNVYGMGVLLRSLGDDTVASKTTGVLAVAGDFKKEYIEAHNTGYKDKLQTHAKVVVNNLNIL